MVNGLGIAIGKPSVGLLWRVEDWFLVEAIAHWYPPVYEPSMQDVARKG